MHSRAFIVCETAMPSVDKTASILSSPNAYELYASKN